VKLKGPDCGKRECKEKESGGNSKREKRGAKINPQFGVVSTTEGYEIGMVGDRDQKTGVWANPIRKKWGGCFVEVSKEEELSFLKKNAFFFGVGETVQGGENFEKKTLNPGRQTLPNTRDLTKSRRREEERPGGGGILGGQVIWGKEKGRKKEEVHFCQREKKRVWTGHKSFEKIKKKKQGSERYLGGGGKGKGKGPGNKKKKITRQNGRVRFKPEGAAVSKEGTKNESPERKRASLAKVSKRKKNLRRLAEQKKQKQGFHGGRKKGGEKENCNKV